jgi:hypothetical protein
MASVFSTILALCSAMVLSAVDMFVLHVFSTSSSDWGLFEKPAVLSTVI